MIRSMTGFARVREDLPDGEIVLSMKAVNHRGLDLHFYLPPELDPFEPALRGLVKQHVSRGHLDIRVTWIRRPGAVRGSWNRTLMESYIVAFREASALFGLSGAPDINAALRIPGMLSDAGAEEAGPEMEALLTGLMVRALKCLNAFREREGQELKTAILERNLAVEAAVSRMEKIRDGALAFFQARLHERLSSLLGPSGVDPQRLAQEAAILADRTDISEEIARLKIHAAQLAAILDAGGEVGKRLDFLLQEMNREANTILSKTGGTGEPGLELTDIAIAAKADIEKIRELVLNLE
jgi:uncharacterized protein (TIGR00255 family)